MVGSAYLDQTRLKERLKLLIQESIEVKPHRDKLSRGPNPKIKLTISAV